jgi:hypothetical protein
MQKRFHISQQTRSEFRESYLLHSSDEQAGHTEFNRRLRCNLLFSIYYYEKLPKNYEPLQLGFYQFNSKFITLHQIR